MINFTSFQLEYEKLTRFQGWKNLDPNWTGTHCLSSFDQLAIHPWWTAVSSWQIVAAHKNQWVGELNILVMHICTTTLGDLRSEVQRIHLPKRKKNLSNSSQTKGQDYLLCMLVWNTWRMEQGKASSRLCPMTRNGWKSHQNLRGCTRINTQQGRLWTAIYWTLHKSLITSVISHKIIGNNGSVNVYN